MLERLWLKSARTNPMVPPENRNDDLANGLAHTWIDLEGAPKQSAQIAWAGHLVSLQSSTQVLGQNGAFALKFDASWEEVFRNNFITKALWQPNPERQKN